MFLGHTRCDLSIVSDLKTVRMSCCCRQWRRASDNPLMYGSTAVVLLPGTGSFVAVCFFVSIMFFTNKNG